MNSQASYSLPMQNITPSPSISSCSEVCENYASSENICGVENDAGLNIDAMKRDGLSDTDSMENEASNDIKNERKSYNNSDSKSSPESQSYDYPIQESKVYETLEKTVEENRSIFFLPVDDCEETIASSDNSNQHQSLGSGCNSYYSAEETVDHCAEESRSIFYLPIHDDWKKITSSPLGHHQPSIGSGCNSFSSANDNVDGYLSEVMSRPRSASIASLEYYRTHNTSLQVSAREELQGPVSLRPNTSDRHTQQSRRLPFWLWFIIAKSLGIKLQEDDRPIVATVLYTLTFMSALGYFLCTWWFVACDIVSVSSKTTIIDGTVNIFLTLFWGALGVYSNKLAYKLFSHKKFLDMLRLHSKTILKMNALAVIFFLMLLIAIFNDINAIEDFRDETCTKIGVEVIVCKLRYLFRVLYSAFAVLWNSLVAFVIVSTCRTHVIGIRRFMQALEQDARVYESRYMGLAQQVNATRPVLEEYTWVDEDFMDELHDHDNSDLDSSILVSQQRSGENRNTETGAEEALDTSSVSSQRPIPRLNMPPSPLMTRFRHSPSTGSLQTSSRVTDADVPPQRNISTGTGIQQDSLSQIKPLMSNSEILFRYWKIQGRLRMSSVALQRWMMSLLCLVVAWLGMNLVLWLNHNPTLIDLANFVLPLALLPLLSSAYAEVNQEGQRLLKFICPLEERMEMLFVLQSAPLQMQVYGFSLTYSTITTAAFGILLAFASKVLLQEISGPSDIVESQKCACTS